MVAADFVLFLEEDLKKEGMVVNVVVLAGGVVVACSLESLDG